MRNSKAEVSRRSVLAGVGVAIAGGVIATPPASAATNTSTGAFGTAATALSAPAVQTTDAIVDASALDVGGATTLGMAVLCAPDAATARSAIGAAPSAGAQELVAGDNITLTSATDLTVASTWGDQSGMISSISRYAINSPALPVGSGNLRLSYFTANRSGTFRNIRCVVGGTPAAATPKLCRMGVYAVAGNGDLALVASTVNDTSLFRTPNTASSKALSAKYAVTAGQIYALAFLVVSSFTTPVLHGVSFLSAIEAGQAPRLNGNVANQTDLALTITAASVANSTSNVYLALTP
jgi:hypothetical protein